MSLIITDANSVVSNFKDFFLCKHAYFGLTIRKKCSSQHSLSSTENIRANVVHIMRYKSLKLGKDEFDSNQWWSRLQYWVDIIRADFQTIISPYLQYISTYLFGTAERMLRPLIMQNSRLIQPCFPSKIVEVWNHRFLRPSSASPICI